MRIRRPKKPDLLLVLTLVTGLGVFTSSVADAGESLFSNVKLFGNVYLNNLRDGDIRMAGNQRAGLHLSSASKSRSSQYVSQHEERVASNSGVRVSWNITW